MIKYIFLILTTLIMFACGKTQSCIDLNNVDVTGVCDNSFNPVCGCDDFQYRNECFAKINGVTSWIGGPCP
jgi:hypothetical protein